MRWIGTIITIAMAAGAIWVIDDLLTTVQFAEVVAEFSSLPLTNIAAALGLTVLSYIMLVLYDAMGLAHIGRALPLKRVALASFTSYVFAHNIGFGLITGTSVRYRLYGSAGLSAVEIATVSLFCGLTFALGITGMSGATLLLEPESVLAAIPDVPFWVGRGLGVVLLAAVVIYVACCVFVRDAVTFSGVEFRFPSLSLSLGQITVSAIDITLAGLAMYALMPQMADISPVAFIGAYVLAIFVGAISNLPGGIGVIEVAMVMLLPDQPAQNVLAGALAYRIIYYFIPFAIASVLIVIAEISERRQMVGNIGKGLAGMLVRFAPQLSGIFVMLAGAILLTSGVIPGLETRLGLLDDLLPLTIVEFSHLLASVVGLGLLILSRGLFRRLDAAYYFAIPALSAGIVLSLLKGFDYEEAGMLALILALVGFNRKEFYRHTPLLAQPFTLGWIVSVGLIIGTSTWIGFFSYRHIEYSNDLWWTFALDADAPRFLRAQFTVTFIALAARFYLVFRPIKPLPIRPTQDDLNTARAIISATRTTDANLALLGDKQLLFNDAKDGFVMYGAQGGSLIALGDPVAKTHEARVDLAWSFRELCDDHDRRPVFYQVTDENLALFIDMGLSLQKLGEEAIVPLTTFSLEGSQRRDLRQSHARAVREGLSFEVVMPEHVPALLHELEAVSNAWLAEKSTREKGFSVGSFSRPYLMNFPCAVIRAKATGGPGRVVGFANLWQGGDHQELSVDLMRHVEDAPYGVMDFLFAEIMLWGKANGFKWFNLGLAPFSGMEKHTLAPAWHRVGAFIFRYGENFYNFEGLRRYKSKFNPEWRAKYLATRGGLNIAAALLDVSTLISRGLRGLVSK